MEALEERSLLAVLVSEALSGTADTTVGGTVYEDLDANGAKSAGENGLAGWTVYLDLDNSGTLNNDAVGTPEPSAETNGDGDYQIKFLKPGTYRVSEVLQPGWSATAPVSQDVVVQKSHDTQADFFDFGGGTITGTIWNDLNADGVRDIDPVSGAFTEPGLADWSVFLDLNQDDVRDPDEPATLTDATGGFTFTGLPASDYEVLEVVPGGWDVSAGFDWKQTATVVALQQTSVEFANFSTLNGSLHGTIWHDTNIDGVRGTDPVTGAFTEPGLADWTVFLDSNRDTFQDPTEPTAVTNARGVYSFISLAAGDYDVVEVLPSGWDVSPTFDSRQTVTVIPGVDAVAGDFANFSNQNGALRGTVWNDHNRNGVRDADLSGAFTEPGLADWTVYLDVNRNRVADPGEPSTLTDGNGGYAFTGLQVGDYEVCELLPSGWEVAPGFSDNQTVAVFGGTESVAPDFANFNLSAATPGSVGGTVWNDLNGNGLRDVDPVSGAFTDPGLTGWTVFADLNGNGLLEGGEPQTTSGTEGVYSIAGILPGSVAIVEVVNPGWRATAPTTRAHTLALKNGDTVVGLDFGNQEVQDAAIRGVVFADTDRNGVRGVTERGLADITVYLDLNNNALLDAGEPQTVTSPDLFFTPAVDETGTYSFTHLAKGTCTVRVIVPAILSATPAAEREHVVTLSAGQDRGGVDTAAVFRPNEIHGVKFDDLNGNHQQDAGEPGMAGTTVFVDLDRDNVFDPGEPSTETAADGSYAFTNLSPGAYVVREIVSPSYERTYPMTAGGTLWPSGVSHPAVGDVSPLSITAALAAGEVHRQTVSLTLPGTGALTNLVDVFLLFDDTGSFVNNSPIVRAAFPDIIATLQASLPGIDLGFGVGRFEEYGDFAYEYGTGRPFILNQPIVAASTAGYLSAIQAALDRTTPGYGGDQPETDIEALYQLVTGLGFDGNNNGSVLDSGPAGPAATQLNPGNSGDVPPFASFAADPTNGVLPAAGTVGGAGFRAGALPIVLVATDTGFAYQPKGETTLTGVGGVTLPLSALTETSRPTTPFNAGAGFQQTVTALNALGALVIGLGTNPEQNLDPRQGLESLSKLTGAINQSTQTIANGTAVPIAPGAPLYFQIASGFAASVANGVVNAIQNAVTNVAVDVTVQASDPRVRLVNHTGILNGVRAGQTARFDVEFVGDGFPRRFDLQFVRAGTNVVLGSIPVVIGTPIPGDGYDFEDLADGQIGTGVDFGDHRTVNDAPVAVSDSYSTDEDVPLTVTGLGVLTNDTDVNKDVLTAVLVANPAHGTVTLQPDGSFVYTPTQYFSGSDSFTYKAHDGTLDSAEATVAITVTNIAPRVTVNQAAGQADPTDTAPLLFTVVFREPVTGFDATDVTLGGTAGATTAVVSPQADGMTYQLSVSGMTRNGTVVVSIPANVASDGAGAGNEAATSTDNSVTFASWHNLVLPCDVNGDGKVWTVDVLLLVNYMNGHRGDTSLPKPPEFPPPLYDVNNDQRINTVDVLTVVNYLNGHPRSGEGESPLTSPAASAGRLAVTSAGSRLPLSGEGEATFGPRSAPAGHIDATSSRQDAVGIEPASRAALPTARPVRRPAVALLPNLDSILDDIGRDVAGVWALPAM